MDGVGIWILDRQAEGHLSELEPGTVWRGGGEVSSCFGFYCAKDVGRTITFVFVVAPCFASRRGCASGPDVGVQRDWLLIQADYGLFRIVGPFISLQNVLHAGEVGVIQFRHAPHFFPATA